MEGEDGDFDRTAILEDHLTPGHMYSNEKVTTTLASTYYCHNFIFVLLKPYHQISRNGKRIISDSPIGNVRAIGCGAYHTLLVIGGYNFSSLQCTQLM